MAGAGYKAWSAGDVLTASDVNTYLMQQSVMTFAGTAARASAVAAPSEGMTTYLADTNTLKTYDGANWVDTNALSETQTSSRNAIINGGFDLNQRGFTSVTADETYSFDRWKQGVYGGTLTTTPQTFTIGNPITGYEPKNFVQLGTASHTANSAYANYKQPIEGVRTFAGQQVTVSFWAKAASGTPGIAVEAVQNFGTSGSPSASVNTYGGKVTLSTSWARYSVTMTIPSISGKTLGTAGNDCLIMHLWLSAGSDFNSRTGSLGNQNGTFSIWGVQVEKGATATPFEVESFGTTLQKCQRYYEKSYDVTTTPGTNTNNGMWQHYCSTDASGACLGHLHFKVNKRTAAYTFKAYRTTGTVDVWDSGRSGWGGSATLYTTGQGQYGLAVYTIPGNAFVPAYLYGHWTCDAEL